MRLQGVTGYYRGLQGDTEGCKGYREFQGLQVVTKGYRWLKEVTRGYRGLQRVTDGYEGLQGITRGYKKLQKVNRRPVSSVGRAPVC